MHAPSSSASEGARHRIAVIDDDGALRDGLAFMLGLEGYVVDSYSDAVAVMAGLDTTNLACLVIDHRLPGLNGLQLLAALRAFGVKAPALLITTQPDSWLRSAAASAGAPIVEKPLLDDALLQAIEAATAGSA